MKSYAKLAVRLFGVAFGLAIALFLFSAVAFGHGYNSNSNGWSNRGNNHPVSYQHKNTVRCNTVRYNTKPCKTVRYNTRSYKTPRCNTSKCNTSCGKGGEILSYNR